MNTKPDLIISTTDAERLEQLLDSLPDTAPGREALEEELSRARIVPPGEIPPTVVTMNSTVKFQVESNAGEDFCLTLVYPKDMDSKGGTISVLAPVGSALLGLSQGDEIEWPKPGGGTLRVSIREVTWQPERAGEFHR